MLQLCFALCVVRSGDMCDSDLGENLTVSYGCHYVLRCGWLDPLFCLTVSLVET